MILICELCHVRGSSLVMRREVGGVPAVGDYFFLTAVICHLFLAHLSY